MSVEDSKIKNKLAAFGCLPAFSAFSEFTSGLIATASKTGHKAVWHANAMSHKTNHGMVPVYGQLRSQAFSMLKANPVHFSITGSSSLEIMTGGAAIATTALAAFYTKRFMDQRKQRNLNPLKIKTKALVPELPSLNTLSKEVLVPKKAMSTRKLKKQGS